MRGRCKMCREAILPLSRSVLQESRSWEVASSNLVIRMVLGWSWEVLDQQQLHGFAAEPVGLHGPEWDDVHIVHQRVGMWHV